MKRSLFILMAVMVASLFAQDIDILLQKADDQHAAYAYDSVYEILKQAEKVDPENFEIIWRLARAHFDLSDNATDKEIINGNIYTGFDYAERALEMDSLRSETHKWYGILIGRKGEIEGTKQKIINSYEVKNHILKAIELDPDDDGNYHVMGQWHFALADLGWVMRKFAAAFFATPPQGTFEEAQDFFRKAIKIDPEDIRNYVWLGKTLEELDDEKGATDAYKKAISLEPDSDSDRILQAEAKDLLADI